jgi:hypothetical protein
MFEYEKPIVEIIDLTPADKVMGGWDDEDENWGSNEDWD